MWLFFHGERVNQLVARVKRRVDGPTAAERVLEVVDEALEEVERTREHREENSFKLRLPKSTNRKEASTIVLMALNDRSKIRGSVVARLAARATRAAATRP